MYINLPQWGDAKIEVSVLKSDESVLDYVIPALMKNISDVSKNFEETKESLTKDVNTLTTNTRTNDITPQY